MSKLKTFESTCNKPYDRHKYKITISNKRELVFDDYEQMRAFWFSQGGMAKMIVTVLDC